MHIAFIPDGNRRWAKSKGLATSLGHYQGSENFGKLLEACHKLKVDQVSLYVLSTENYLNRSPQEVDYLLNLLSDFTTSKRKQLLKNKISLKVHGRIEDLPADKIKPVLALVEETKNFKEFKLNIFINYGGRDEIVRAAQKASLTGLITEQSLAENLDLKDEPNLIIRTGGHSRISNFLLWQGAYSEWYFSDKLWPDFSPKDLETAIEFYNNQDRNFGK
ncbi:MAG: polyprenyl diphosphate synthase [bacterium]